MSSALIACCQEYLSPQIGRNGFSCKKSEKVWSCEIVRIFRICELVGNFRSCETCENYRSYEIGGFIWSCEIGGRENEADSKAGD